MDLDSLLARNQRSLIAGDRAMSPRDKRAHAQFAREYSEQILRTREALVGPALPGSHS